MKIFCTLFLTLHIFLLHSQNFLYPQIIPEGKKPLDFIPVNWTLRDSASGDLNKDHHIDFALVLQYKDSVQLVQPEGTYTDTVVTQPRILVILFFDSLKNNYRLVEQSNTFILNYDNPFMNDPLASIHIEKGILHIHFNLFFSIGTWMVMDTEYNFRYQSDQFVLIGADNNSYSRTANNFENYSYNFLSGKWSLSTGDSGSGKKPKVQWFTLPPQPLQTFKTFLKPYTWEVTKDVYLDQNDKEPRNQSWLFVFRTRKTLHKPDLQSRIAERSDGCEIL